MKEELKLFCFCRHTPHTSKYEMRTSALCIATMVGILKGISLVIPLDSIGELKGDWLILLFTVKITVSQLRSLTSSTIPEIKALELYFHAWCGL